MTDEQMGSLQRRLRLDKPVRVCRPLDRSNLRYEVRYLATTSDEHVLQAIVSFVYARGISGSVLMGLTGAQAAKEQRVGHHLLLHQVGLPRRDCGP